jgi:hypothetical protein
MVSKLLENRNVHIFHSCICEYYLYNHPVIEEIIVKTIMKGVDFYGKEGI